MEPQHVQQGVDLKGQVGAWAVRHYLARALQDLMHLQMQEWSWHCEQLVIQLGDWTKQLGQKVGGKLQEVKGLVVLG